MPSAPTLAKPYRFENLPVLTRSQVTLWNWYCRVAPGRTEWRTWVAEIFSRLLEKPAGERLQLVQTHLVEAAKFAEKTLVFGTKQEILLGRAEENDVILPANAISGKHARVFLKDGRAYLEDLGGRLGTYLWEQRIPPQAPQVLSNGDQFTVFPFRFRVLVERSWIPETAIALSECEVQPGSQGEFMKTSPPGARTFLVNADATGERAILQTSPAFLAKLQGRILGPLGLDRIKGPVPSDDALLGFVLLAFLERLNRRLKFPWHFSFVSGAREIRSDATPGMRLTFAVGVGDATGPFRIFIPLTFLSSESLPAAAEPAMAYPPNLAWRFPVSAGFVDLLPEEIAQVGLGDILVAQFSAAVLFPNDFSRRWQATVEGSNFSQFKIDKYLEGGTAVPPGSDTSAIRPAIETLPLRLHVIVGEKEMTLAEMQGLTPGTIVELGGGKAETVRLMVNGAVLGEGELVEVEGNLAVKVLRWRTA